MTLEQYESEIEGLERLEPETRFADLECASLPEECAYRLSRLSQSIRRTLWSQPFRQWARDLALRADLAAQRIAAEHDLVYGGRLPRFEAFYSGGHYCNPVD